MDYLKAATIEVGDGFSALRRCRRSEDPPLSNCGDQDAWPQRPMANSGDLTRRWVSVREQRRRFLFGHKAELYPKLDGRTTSPLTAIAFCSRLGGVRYGSSAAQAEITTAVHSILHCHDRMARSRGPALFGLVDRRDVGFIADLTAGVIQRWEQACRVHGIYFPFKDLVAAGARVEEFIRCDVQLVVEAASAVVETLQLGYWVTRDVAGRAASRFMGFVAQRGPCFAQAWLRGDFLRDYYKEQGGVPAGVFSIMTPSRLKSYALYNVRDPLDASIAMIERFNSALAPSVVAAEVGWTQDRVIATFTAEVRTKLAERCPNNPLVAAKRLARHLDTVLTTENLARELDVEPDFVDMLFTARNRRDLACLVDPLAAARRKVSNFRQLTTSYIAAETGWTPVEVDEVFDFGTRRRLAMSTNLAARVRAVAFAFKDKLSEASIAQRLGWTERDVASLFTVSVRRKLAIGNTSDSLRGVDRIAQTRAELIREFQLQLPLEIINAISIRNKYKNAVLVAHTVAGEVRSCPPLISLVIWLGIVARSPNASRKEWLEKAALYIRQLELASQLKPSVFSYDASRYEPSRSVDYVDQIFPGDPDEFLQGLAFKAGVSYQDLGQLLRHFEGADAVLSSRELDMLRRLREAVAHE